MADTFGFIAPAVLIVVVVVGVYFMTSNSAPNIGNDLPIHTKVTPHFWRGTEQPDATLTVTHNPTGQHFVVDLFHDQLLERPGSPVIQGDDGTTTPVFSGSIEEHRYFGDPGLDLGIWVGLETGTKIYDHSLDYGVRIGFTRYVANRFSPDFLFSGQVVGGGIGFFPDPNSSSRFLRHIGTEVGYVYSIREHSWCVLLGLSTEFKF